MTTAEFLSRVRDMGINLWVDGDDLRYSAPKGTLTPELRAEMVERKAEILALLRETRAAAPPSQTDEAKPEPGATFVAPRTPTEETLARIWAEVLGIEQVGVHDNFFELGGDSILGMQVIALANQAGLQFIPRQLLEHQTVAELAAVEGTVLPVQAEQGPVTGAVPLTVGQSWFFRAGLPENRYNIAGLYEVHQALDPVLLKQAVWHILVHHDALRARFVREDSGWRQFIVEPDEAVPFVFVDISGLPAAEHSAAIEAAAEELQGSLNLSEGPLLRVALFDLGPSKPGRLLVIVHHSADGESFRILWEDLQAVYWQLSSGKRVRLPPKTTSVKEWSERLNAYARSVEARREWESYWLTLPWEQIPPLPLDYPEGNDIVDSHRFVQVSLSSEETNFLRRKVPRIYQATVEDVFLMALVHTITQWTGARWVLLGVLDSGRTAMPGIGDVDLSRTVGWLVVRRHLVLEREMVTSPGDALKSIREQLRRIPNRGLGFDFLSFLGEDAEAVEEVWRLRDSFYRRMVSVNYRGGQVGQSPSLSGVLRPARESAGRIILPHAPLGEAQLECLPVLQEDRFTVYWDYSRNLHKRATIERVADGFVGSLQALIAYCQSSEESQL